MKITFTPGPGVKVIHSSEGVTINARAADHNGPEVEPRAEARAAVELPPLKSSEEFRLTRAEITATLGQLQTAPDAIVAPELAADFRLLLQVIEGLSAENEHLKAEIQRLRDALRQFQGEQGQPQVKVAKKKRDISSESDRRRRQAPQKKKSKAKKHKLKIDRTVLCPVDLSVLPEDAVFKGYQRLVVQDIIIQTDNVEYKKEVYYSAAQQKTYTGTLPPEIAGEFGPGVKTLVYTQKHVANMSEPKIKEFLENVGIYISAATISRILTHDPAGFQQEKAAIFQAGLAATRYQQVDDTGARVNGQNQYVQIFCNPYYTAYFTTPRKDRLSVLDIMLGGQTRSYCFNTEAFHLLATFRVSQKIREQLRALAWGQVLNEEQMQQVLQQLFPHPPQGKNTRTRIREAGAIAAYHQQTDCPVIPILLSDDAPQFKQLTPEQALCWIHDGRHYKKLHPVVPCYQEQLGAFREQYWDYYQKLLVYQQSPDPEQVTALSVEFDELFATATDYPALAARIAKSKAKKAALLLVLQYPELPLHNNAAELGARAQARKRDVSLHTMSAAGTQAQDTFLTIVQTAKKLGVSAYDYIYDRVSQRFRLPSLAELIRLQSAPEAVPDNTS